MAIVWGAVKDNFRLGIDLIDSGGTFTWIVYGQSINFGHGDSASTLTFSGTWGTATISVRFYSAWGETKTMELHRTTGFRVSSSNGATFNSYTVSGAYAGRSVTVTPKPSAPSNVKVKRNSDSSHTVSWTRNSTATSVRLERSTNGGSYSHVRSTSSNAYELSDTSTVADRRYRYRVRVANAGGTSDWAYSGYIYTTPRAPSSMTARRVGDNILVDSSSLPGYGSHYEIQDGTTTVSPVVARAALPWTHTAPDPAEPHQYRMRSRVASGTSNGGDLWGPWSDYSGTVQLTTPPAPPTGLKPNGAFLEPGTVEFVWQHNPLDSSVQSAFQLQYRSVGGAWVTVTGTDAETVAETLNDAGVYEFQVRTKGSHPDWSQWSAVAAFTIVTVPLVTIVSPEDGTYLEASLPVEWSFHQDEGRPQSSWRADLSFDGNIIESKQGTGADTTTTFETLVEDATDYTVEVSAATSGIWSPVESVTITVDFIPPMFGDFSGAWEEQEGSISFEVWVGDDPGMSDPTAIKVERSVDDGITWVSILPRTEIEPTDVLQRVDYESLSNGVTLYRVTTFAATGAATVSEYPVGSYSDALWLGGGAAFFTTARLPYSPQVSINAGRERALKQYSGRKYPVAYAGEALSRVVSTNGFVLVDEDDNMQVDALGELAQNSEPIHLYRDPDGRHIYGMIDDINTSRESHVHWGYSFKLTETGR